MRGSFKRTGNTVMVGLLLVFILSLSGCIKITGTDGQTVEVRQTEDGLVGLTTNSIDELTAMVKGSIYESGELVSVFGTCLDGDQGYIPNVTAVLNAWYPNGTNFITSSSMSEIDPGRFLYTGPMEAVRGTYLTELVCEKDGQYAYAWGEWQNPYWVQRINDTQSLVNITLQEVQENQDLINNLSFDVETGFNQTFIQINNTNTSLYNEIINVGIIANNSVDRNDSYIVELILYLLNGSTITNPFYNQSLIIEEEADTVFFRRNWQIDVTVQNALNVTIGFPVVSCFITTTNDPPTVNEAMDSQGSDSNPWFRHTEFITVKENFNWTVSCGYN